MRLKSFLIDVPPLQREANGFYLLSVEKMPAFRPEPHMPPEEQVRPWVLVHYMRTSAPEEPLAFWKDFGKGQFDLYRPLIKVTDEIRRAAAEASAGATTADARATAIFRYVRDRIARTDVDTAPADLARGDVRDRAAKDVLKRGKGDAIDVLVLYLAMAQAAGLETRLGLVADRSDIPFSPESRAAAVLPGRIVALPMGDSWRFVDPANRYAADGRLRWQHEQQAVLVAGGREPEFLSTPSHRPESAGRKRTGRFRLLADGTLEGDLSVEYTGHWGVSWKEGDGADTPAEREDAFRKLLTDRLTGVEVSAVKIENVTSFDAPYRASASVRVPGYAQRVGSRLIVQTSFFERGLDPAFTSPDRRHPVFYPYARIEEDEVTFELPSELQIEAKPASNRVALRPVMTHEVTFEESAGRLVCRRVLRLGENGMIDFEPGQYAAVKDFLDRVRAVDARPITLRRTPAAP
jgi:transglutaminase-like putative cysteine protease